MQKTTGQIFHLRNTIRNYAWGSYDGLSKYAALAVDRGKPSAEYWMGSHPAAPSAIMLPDGTSLSLQKFIHNQPIKTLGDEVFSEYGDLPFLFKVLSASMPLSIQVHPDKSKAEEGFDREEKSGLPKSALERNYKDRNHKPELAVALSRFSALCGFRPAREAADLLGPDLCVFLGFSPEKGKEAFRSLLGKALTLCEKDRLILENMAVLRAKELVRSDDANARLSGETVLLCFEHYPHDSGGISPFFMSIKILEPGQGLYIPAGVMHAYLNGTILEIMATSDNVIRGGLTHKHIDIGDLLHVLDFNAEPLMVEPCRSEAKPQETVWKTPAREFYLSRLDLSQPANLDLATSGPEILLCTDGSFSIGCNIPAVKENSPDGKNENLPDMVLKQGESAFVGASCRGYVLKGSGTLYRACTSMVTEAGL